MSSRRTPATSRCTGAATPTKARSPVLHAVLGREWSPADRQRYRCGAANAHVPKLLGWDRADSLRASPGALAMSATKEDCRGMRVLRAEADVILMGASNLRADDPAPKLRAGDRTLRSSDQSAHRCRVGAGGHPAR